MSTLKTNNIQHVDRSDPSIIINTDGSVNIAGTMTYEDVTNVDAVGIITGRSNIDAQKQVLVGTGVSIAAGGLNVTAGITTVQALQVATISGTTGTFSGDIKTTAGTVNVKSGSSINTNSDTSAHGALHKNTNSGEFAVVSGGTGGNNYLSFYTAASAAPTEKVRINHSGSIQATLEGSTSNPYMLIDTSGDSVRFHAKKASGNNEFRFLTQSSGTVTERLRINTDGQLIHNVSKASGYIAEFHQDNSGNSAQILIDSPTDNNIRPTSIDLAQAGTVKWSLGQAYASSSSQAFHIATSSLSANDTNAKLTITTAGLIGIGTAVPDQTLEVFKASGTNLVKVSSQANSTVGLEIEKTGATTQSWRIVDGQTGNGKLEFYDVTDSATRMTIDGLGRIGINNSTPSESLHVSGNIINTESVGGTGDKGIMLGNGHRLGLDQSGTRSWTFKPTNGQLQLNSGDGAGSFRLARVAFGSDSADANCLDDYEEGSWTPDLHFGGHTTGITYSNRQGSYTKIGRVVTLNWTIELSSKGSASGDARIYGYPVSPAALLSGTSVQANGVSSYWNNFDPDLYYMAFFASTAYISIRSQDGNGLTDSLDAMSNSDFGNSSTFRGSITYFAT